MRSILIVLLVFICGLKSAVSKEVSNPELLAKSFCEMVIRYDENKGGSADTSDIQYVEQKLHQAIEEGWLNEELYARVVLANIMIRIGWYGEAEEVLKVGMLKAKKKGIILTLRDIILA